MAWCLMLSTQPRNRATSKGLRTTGSLCGGLGAGRASSKVHAFLSVTFVEEAQRRDGDRDRGRRQLPVVGQVDLPSADLVRSQLFRRSAEVAGEQGDLQDVGGL